MTIETATEAVDDQRPVLAAATEKWMIAKRAETDRIAIELQPRHREAVRAMARAVEDLSRAIAAERLALAEEAWLTASAELESAET